MSNSKFPYEVQDAVVTGQSLAKVHNPVNQEKATVENDFEESGLDGIPENGAYTNGIMGL